MVKKAKEEGKKTGLITGCFDILHLGHIEVFRFAKKRVDILVVGVDSDESIRISKGEKRPFNSLQKRMDFLQEISLVDYTFPIIGVIPFGSNKASKVHKSLLRKLKPDYLITGVVADKFWKDKKKVAKELGIKFLADERRRGSESTKIIEKLEEEL